MLSNLSRHFHNSTRVWLILLLFITLVIFMIITLPDIQAVSGNIEGLDTLFFYTPEEAFANIASYSETGRNVLLKFHLSVDVVNPILYTSFLILLISWLFRRSFAPQHWLQRLNVVPLGAAISDLLENICIAIMISVYPSQPGIIAWLSTLSSMSKYIFIYGSFGLVLIGSIKVITNKFSKDTFIRSNASG